MAKKPAVVNVISNEEILKYLKEYHFDFKLNEVSGKIEVSHFSDMRPMDDFLWAKIIGQMRVCATAMNVKDLTGERNIDIAVKEAAYERRYNPIKEYLERCRAGYAPSERSLIKEFCALIPVDPAHIESRDRFFELWLIGCVARVYGGFQNWTLILQGGQGVGKSTTFAKLCAGFSDFYTEEHLNVKDKDHKLMLSSKFIWQMEEFGSLLKTSDRNAVKAFLTKGDSDLRVSYDKYSLRRTRICNMAGSVNDDSFLTDPTGNRRFLIVKITEKIQKEMLTLDMNKLWGEIAHMYHARGSEILKFSEADKAMQDLLTDGSEIIDPIESLMSDWFEISATEGAFIPTADIATKLSKTNIVSNNYLSNKIADFMQKLGYKTGRKGGYRGYLGVRWQNGCHPDATLESAKREAAQRQNPKERIFKAGETN